MKKMSFSFFLITFARKLKYTVCKNLTVNKKQM